MSTEGGLPRWVRWGPLVAAVATAAALVATLTVGYLGAKDASATLARGQRDIFLQAALHAFHSAEGLPTNASLAAFLADHRDDGLRYVALVHPDGALFAEAGAPAGARPAAGVALPRPGITAEIGDRIRFVAPPPPHPPPGPGPSPHPPPGPGPYPYPPPGSPPVSLLLEYEPVLAHQIETEGRRNLAIGGAAAIAFVVFALLFGRVLRRQQALERHLDRDRRLAALGEMSAVLAHEIRNPLASLKGHAQLLLEGLPEEGRRQSKVARVVREAVRLETLTTDLLDFARSGEIKREEADPADLLRSAVEEVDPARFDVCAQDAPQRWSLDANRMRQALGNVLRNALQTSAPAGRAAASVARAGDRLVFTVRDFGEGIPSGEEERIFEPFHTGKVHGTGLGLAVARHIVERHGGTIAAGNHPGGGAEFRLSIPRG
ncbi:MAG: ATP-binding protein [Myxococcota bacterium]|nr:ATP-binding protein [Myxococcota bacterium]